MILEEVMSIAQQIRTYWCDGKLHSKFDELLAIMFCNAGMLYLQQKRWKDALYCANNALTFDNHCLQAHRLRIEYYCNSGDYNTALNDVYEILSLDDEHVYAIKMKNKLEDNHLPDHRYECTEITVDNCHPMSKMPCAREKHSAVAWKKSQLIVYGGRRYDKHSIILNDVWILDISTKRWMELKHDKYRPCPRQAHTAHIINNKLYVIGGMSSDCLSRVEMKENDYDTDDMKYMNMKQKQSIANQTLARKYLSKRLTKQAMKLHASDDERVNKYERILANTFNINEDTNDVIIDDESVIDNDIKIEDGYSVGTSVKSDAGLSVSASSSANSMADDELHHQTCHRLSDKSGGFTLKTQHGNMTIKTNVKLPRSTVRRLQNKRRLMMKNSYELRGLSPPKQLSRCSAHDDRTKLLSTNMMISDKSMHYPTKYCELKQAAQVFGKNSSMSTGFHTCINLNTCNTTEELKDVKNYFKSIGMANVAEGIVGKDDGSGKLKVTFIEPQSPKKSNQYFESMINNNGWQHLKDECPMNEEMKMIVVMADNEEDVNDFKEKKDFYLKILEAQIAKLHERKEEDNKSIGSSESDDQSMDIQAYSRSLAKEYDIHKRLNNDHMIYDDSCFPVVEVLDLDKLQWNEPFNTGTKPSSIMVNHQSIVVDNNIWIFPSCESMMHSFFSLNAKTCHWTTFQIPDTHHLIVNNAHIICNENIISFITPFECNVHMFCMFNTVNHQWSPIHKIPVCAMKGYCRTMNYACAVFDEQYVVFHGGILSKDLYSDRRLICNGNDGCDVSDKPVTCLLSVNMMNNHLIDKHPRMQSLWNISQNDGSNVSLVEALLTNTHPSNVHHIGSNADVYDEKEHKYVYDDESTSDYDSHPPMVEFDDELQQPRLIVV